MEKFIYLLNTLAILISFPVFAQNNWQAPCGAAGNTNGILRLMDTIVNGDSVIIIPTVFHIITQGGPENLSKSHIHRALEILNQDFNRQNPDTFDIPLAFHPLRGNPKIEFRLARLDPQGNCTDGIDRVYSPLTNGTGGASGSWLQMQPNFEWDHTRYMNIYITRWMDQTNNARISGVSYIAPVDTGFNGPPNWDALVMAYSYIADSFNGVPPGFRSHTLSHEMGHNLGLFHPWGSGPGCTDDDEVSDTPLQDDANQECPTFPHITCNNGPDGDMFNNFMDYVECKNMFSKGQVDRMRTCLSRNDWRKTLWTPSNLIATGVDTSSIICQNPPVADFGYGNFADWICAGQPVQFYEACSWNPSSFNWEFTGGFPATSIDTFPSVVYADTGTYQVRLIVSNNLGSDTVEKTIRIMPAEITYDSLLTESFEDSLSNLQLLPYSLLNTKKWSVTNLAAFNGSHSIRLDSSLQYLSSFYTHGYDLNLLPATDRILQFKVALGLAPFGAAINGGLRIVWKRPCAGERVQLEGPAIPGSDAGCLIENKDVIPPDSLKTFTGNAVFIPNNNQWKTISISIPDSITGEVQFGFMWANWESTIKFRGLYIDDIKVIVSTSTGISENTPGVKWKLFPNPATDKLTIQSDKEIKIVSIKIMDVDGKVIWFSNSSIASEFDIDTNKFTGGVYIIQLITHDLIQTRKVLIVR